MMKKATPTFPGRRRRWLRLVALALALSLLGVLLWRWQNLAQAGLQVERQQISVMARALTSQAAYAAGQLMSNGEDKALQGLADRLAKEPQLLDAAIYDATGSVLARSGSDKPVLSLLEKADENRLIPYVSEIQSAGQVLGYLRITLTEDEVVHDARTYRKQVGESLRLMLLMAILMGFLLALVVRR
ncbi:putative SerB-cotransposed membrane protein [Gallaecimonas xiamenensis 3-C-1]|uniref:Putative SerB-cotransposed membrane protein n=2 Tax=Gallaecimonas TaxID=745410 RepID=K2JPJ1_9GAMM|nr:putative SerB-cotransposed membrane protein [Gallaecimonas xiamenensis 3-C-1]